MISSRGDCPNRTDSRCVASCMGIKVLAYFAYVGWLVIDDRQHTAEKQQTSRLDDFDV